VLNGIVNVFIEKFCNHRGTNIFNFRPFVAPCGSPPQRNLHAQDITALDGQKAKIQFWRWPVVPKVARCFVIEIAWGKILSPFLGIAQHALAAPDI
jgi:hypothetical protein